MLDSVTNERGCMTALDAAVGTGKTFLLTTRLATVRVDDKEVLATATSSIAAIIILKKQFTYRCLDYYVA